MHVSQQTLLCNIGLEDILKMFSRRRNYRDLEIPFLNLNKIKNNNNLEDIFSVDSLHCVKSVRIRSYSYLHFPAFGLNRERYSVFIPNAGKYGTE